jgi:hypothetical protein
MSIVQVGNPVTAMTINNPSNNPVPMIVGAAQTTPIAAGKSTDTVIKAAPGTFYGIIITSVGVGGPLIYDNASTSSGTIVGSAIVSAPLGFISGPYVGIQCVNGITVKGGATMPGMTILWS